MTGSQRMGDIGEPLKRIEFDPMREPAPAEPEPLPVPEPVKVPA
jgi:hypothetical protein